MNKEPEYDTIKIEIYIHTDKVGSKCTDILEFDRDEWEAMDDDDREESCKDAVWNMAEWGYREADDD